MQPAHTLVYRNNTNSPIRVVVEPWARQYLIGPSTEVEFRFFDESSSIGRIELEEGGKYLSLWPPEGGSVRLFIDGSEIEHIEQE